MESQSLPLSSSDIKTNISLMSVEEFHALSDEEKDNGIILDLGQAQTYYRGHLPGAVHLPVTRIVRQEGYATGLLPTAEQLGSLAQEYDLCCGKTIYIYDDEGGGWAGRMAWILDILAVDKVVYIDGGLRAWMHAGFPLSSQLHEPVAGEKPKELNLMPNLKLEELEQLIGQENGQKNVNIIDARSLGEYKGVRQFAQKAGHIPGAKHYEWTQAIHVESNFSFRELDVLRQELASLFDNMDGPFVVYCQTHHRSGLSYLMCRLLGLKVRAYAGSWSEWGNHPSTPIQETNVQVP